MLRILVLGAAAGGGLPQWNCGCPICTDARQPDQDMGSSQASIAVSADGEHWFIVNASPDLRQQINDNPALHPKPGALRHSPIAGVILTNGEVDAVAGLLTLREGWPFTIYAHQSVLSVLAANSIFNVLNDKLVRRQAIAAETAFDPKLPDGRASGLEITPFAAPGKTALYLEGDDADPEGMTLGLMIKDKAEGRYFCFACACAEVTPELADRMAGAPLVFFDGTLWRDDEMIALGLSQKTGRRMGHISMSGEAGSIAALEPLGIDRKIFLHINNSNPAWQRGSPERQRAEAAGWQIGRDGMEITL